MLFYPLKKGKSVVYSQQLIAVTILHFCFLIFLIKNGIDQRVFKAVSLQTQRNQTFSVRFNLNQSTSIKKRSNQSVSHQSNFNSVNKKSGIITKKNRVFQPKKVKETHEKQQMVTNNKKDIAKKTEQKKVDTAKQMQVKKPKAPEKQKNNKSIIKPLDQKNSNVDSKIVNKASVEKIKNSSKKNSKALNTTQKMSSACVNSDLQKDKDLNTKKQNIKAANRQENDAGTLSQDEIENYDALDCVDVLALQLSQEIFKRLPMGITSLPKIALTISIDENGKVIKQTPETVKPLVYNSAIKQVLAFFKFPLEMRNKTIIIHTN